MKVSDLLRKRAELPRKVQMDWPLDEYLRSERRVRAKVLAGLDRWRWATFQESRCGGFSQHVAGMPELNQNTL
jgi:hypothetical protein